LVAEGAEFSLSEEDEADEDEEEEDEEEDDDASECLLFLLLLLDVVEGWVFPLFSCEICEASSWASETASIPAYSCKPASSL